MKYFYSLLTIFFITISGWSQISDSLENAAASSDPEVARPALARKYSILVQKGHVDQVIEEINEHLDKHQHKDNTCIRALFYNILGTAHYYKGAFKECTDLFSHSIELWEKCGDESETLRTRSNLASIYGSLGKLDTAINLFKQNLEDRIEIKDTTGIIATGINIAEAYRLKGKYELALEEALKALKFTNGEDRDAASLFDIIANLNDKLDHKEEAYKYWKKAYDIRLKVNDPYGIASSELNMGIHYSYEEDYDSAIYFFEKAIVSAEKINNISIVAYAKNDLANIYKRQGKYDQARAYFDESIAMFKSFGDLTNLGSAYINVGDVEMRLKNYSAAIENFKKGLDIRKEINTLDGIRDAHLSLSVAYDSVNNKSQALYHHRQYVIYQDSVLNKENLEQINAMKIKYETEKKELLSQKRALENEKLKTEGKLKDKKIESQTEKITLYSVIIIIVIALAVLIFIALNRQRKLTHEIRLQKGKVEEQKYIVEEKNNEILESIQYAKRLQGAILPEIDHWRNHFPESFVLYKPKDIVAGDFYWMNVQGDEVYFAVADCTGHGVPGAMVSFVCFNALENTLKNNPNANTDEVLNETRKLVIDTFSARSKNINDGMDISLCKYNKKSNKLQFSGAYNSIWIITGGSHLNDQQPNDIVPHKNSESNMNLYEWKGDKSPIGKSPKKDAFTSIDIQLQKGDTVYLTSDGYADQFGGDKGKKLKSKSFKELLLTLQTVDIKDQGGTLSEYFIRWSKDYEQIDDVCVVGVVV